MTLIDFESWKSINLVFIITAPFTLLIQFTIGIMACINFRKHSSTNVRLMILFYMSLVTACSAVICTCIAVMIDFMGLSPEWFLRFQVIAGSLFLAFMLCVEMTLVVRLHLMFKMTKCIYRGFILLFLWMSMVTITSLFQHYLPMIWGKTIGSILTISYIVIFVFGSGMAVFCFVVNLGKLATSRAGRVSAHHSAITESDISLDRGQHRLIALASKYMLLFGIATLSTVLTWCLVLVVDSHLSLVLVPVDWVTNTTCLYLQFSFSSTSYRHLCGCLDTPCTKVMTRWTKRTIYKRAIEMIECKSMSLHHVQKVEATTKASTMPEAELDVKVESVNAERVDCK